MLAVASLLVALISCNSTPKTALTDGEWVLHSLQTTAGDEMVVTTNKPTMTFGDSAQLNGFAGCNGFFGSYKVTGEEIKIDLGGMTLKMCADMDVENSFVTEMPMVSYFDIDGNQLILKNQDKKELFRFDHVSAPKE